MTKKQKKVLYRILAAAALTVLIHFLPVSDIALFFLYLVPYLIIGYDVLRKAVLGILHGEVFDENFLMAVATVGAMALGLLGEGSCVESVEVMLFYQIGELFQSCAVGKSRRSITELMDIRPDYANVEKDGSLVQTDPDEVSVGEVIVIRPGERVPLDGVVLEGSSSLNTSALTGESVPRQVGAGDDIISGCVNTSGLLKVEVTKPYAQSTVSKILDLVENSKRRKRKTSSPNSPIIIRLPSVPARYFWRCFPRCLREDGWTGWDGRSLSWSSAVPARWLSVFRSPFSAASAEPADPVSW